MTYRPSHILDARMADWAAGRTSADVQDGHKRLILAHLAALRDLVGSGHAGWFLEALAGFSAPPPQRGDARVGADGWAEEFADGWFCPRWRGVSPPSSLSPASGARRSRTGRTASGGL